MFFKRILPVAAACALVAACATPDPMSRIGQDDPFFGESVAYNAALQTINPDPVYPDGAAEPGSNGAQSAAAVARLRSREAHAQHRAEAQAGSLSTTEGTSSGSGPR